MKWIKLTIQNFLAINEATVDLDNQGLILIEGDNQSDDKYGSNGSGKSTLIPESVAWCLFNKISKGAKADEVVNNKIGKDTMVSLEGELDGDTYIITRYRKHSKFGNKVKVSRNGTDITAKTDPDTNKLIENLVGVSHLTFLNSILFAQGGGLGAFASLTDSSKKEILDSILKLDVYSKAQEIAKDIVKESQKKIDEKNKELEKLDWELQQVDRLEQEDINRYESTKQSLAAERVKLGEVIKQQNDYPAQYFGFVEQHRDEIIKLKESLEEIANIDVSVEEEAYLEAYDKLNSMSNKEKELTYQKNQLVKNYKQLDSSDTCPMCGNPIDTTHIITEQQGIRKQLEPIVLELRELAQLRDQLIADCDTKKAAYEAKKVERSKVVIKQSSIHTEIQNKESYIRTYENNLQKLKHNVEIVKSNIEKLSTVTEPKKRDDERAEIEKKIKVAKKELVALELDKKENEDVVKVYSNEGVKSHVLDLITPVLNEKGNKYLKQLAGENMELEFSTRTLKKDKTYSDKFDVKLMNHVGGDNYKLNSGGEKKRADLAISLALQDLIATHTNFIVYDEVFDALDDVGIESVLELLKERAKVIGSVFVITQSSHFKALFEKVITITKDKHGISRINKGDKMDEGN
ncbi:exonuclease [Bacillus phage Evoli]|uniref:Exonuclease I n=1 Tax=Bacillus phage Evoli TaxID=1486658 RepID=A0A024B1H2_9CAUD|nr:exonuclease [Bacillus phage Evoli]AHZ09843.1 exonuclease I [Bacillus phage Evoli]